MSCWVFFLSTLARFRSRSCHECSSIADCGYCFLDDPATGISTGTCLLSNANVTEFASDYGPCSNANISVIILFVSCVHSSFADIEICWNVGTERCDRFECAALDLVVRLVSQYLRVDHRRRIGDLPLLLRPRFEPFHSFINSSAFASHLTKFCFLDSSKEWDRCRGRSTRKSTRCGRAARATASPRRPTGSLTSWFPWRS